MRLNADFNKRVVVHSLQMEWMESPMQGVARRPLDRIGNEVARATSIVKYKPGSHFSPHVHTGGEEFLVLEGVFQDEYGDYPVGSYCRNPPQSSHTPGSTRGCVIFVKLWQFQPDDSTGVRLDTNLMRAIELRDHVGVSVIPLYKDSFEEVSIERWAANTEITMPLDGGAELLVLDGSFTESGETLVKHSWLRLPVSSSLRATTGNQPARVWVKRGHLLKVDDQEARIPV
ncbi:MAG: anti-sigma factor ChrR (cupin superfamily) [Arenicella sp.]|jgi:anti-sigma factor ChrR (cupin superfamily)